MRRRILLALLALAVLAGLALAWLLGTAGGARWIAARAVAAVPGLSIAAVDGRLVGTLRLGEVRWDDGSTAVDARTLEARIALLPLLAGRAHLHALQADGVAVVLRAGDAGAASPADDAPTALPQVSIDALRLGAARLDAGGRTFVVDRVDAVVAMGGRRIAISGLEIAGPDARLDGTLELDLDRSLPAAAADLRFELRMDDARYAGSAMLAPSGDADAINLTLTAPVQATLDGRADADWAGAGFTLSLPRQDGTAFGIDAAIGAELRAEFADGRWSPRGELAYGEQSLSIDDGVVRVDAAGLRFDCLLASSPRHGTLRIDGDAPRDGDGRWALRLAGDGLRWPRENGDPLQLSGALAIEGPARTPVLRPDLRLRSAGLPEARVQGSVAREGSRYRIEGLLLEAPPSRARIDGMLSFDQPASLQARIEALDPALFDRAWPGRVDARLAFDGMLGEAGPTGSLVLDDLGGELRGRPLGGAARLRFDAGRWREGTASLRSGSARIEAQARDGGAWIEARALAADLADLWPGAQGELDATWRRDAGDRLALRARELSHDGIALARLEVDARLGDGRDAPLSARVVAGRLAARGQAVDAVTLDVEGSLGAHVARLQVDDAGRGGSARLEGAWRDGAWSGSLQALDARAEGASLRLREPAAVALGAQASQLAPACFDTTGGRLCLAASHRDGAGEATLELDGLSLAALRAWIADPRIPAVEGLASGRGGARWDATGLVEANARLESPRGLARLPKRPDLDLGYADLVLDADWTGDAGRVTGSARLVPEGRLDLAAALSRLEGGLGVDATLDVLVTDLSGIEAFTTTIAEPEGELRGQLRIRGGALPPSLSGALALTGFTAQVPAQAVRLREGVMVLAGVPGQLVLRGSVLSGDGTLSIDGRIDRDDPVPALLRIGGERFRVANTPNLSLLATPDLTLALRDGRWQLDGRLDIPRARIDASKLETGADRSPDVVVLDDPEPPDPKRPWRARVRVSLGDDVRLAGFGFDGTLQGALDVSQRQGAQALASGEVTLLGRYAAYGQRLDIKRGGLRWANSPLADPTLDLRAERKVRGETVALEVRGNATSPSSQVVAGAGTSDSEALALLVTGRPLNRAGAEDRERLSDASAALGAVGSQLLTRSLGGRLGLDEIGVSNDTRLDGEAFTLGKYLSPRLYVGYGIGILTRGEVFTVRYLVTDRIELEANAGATQRAAVNWRIER